MLSRKRATKRNMGDSYLLEKETKAKGRENTELHGIYSVFPRKTCGLWQILLSMPKSYYPSLSCQGTSFAYVLSSQMFSRDWYGLRVNLDWSAPTIVNPFPLPVTKRGIGISYEGKSFVEPLERDRRKEAVSLVLEHYCVRISLLQLLYYLASLKDKGM